MNTTDAYTKVTERLLDALDNGTVPWHKPWQGGAPLSIHGRPYRGINAVILAMSGYSSNVWLTYQQARERGGHVRKGEKGTPVILFKVSKRQDTEKAASEDPTGSRTRLFATTFTVFNFEQCEGVELPERHRGNDVPPIEAAEAITTRYLENGPRLVHGGARAGYCSPIDTVRMPPRTAFDSAPHYYATLFHELGHSTGHETRLDRDGIARFDGFGSHQYSREELIAEICAAMLCGVARIENAVTLENAAAYLRHWRSVLKDDPGAIVRAASHAQKAADLVLGVAKAEEQQAA
jgi:antirestriction protein ArdC